jgi:hypothetical protein
VEGAFDLAQKAIRQGADVNKLFENDGSFFTPILVLASYHQDLPLEWHRNYSLTLFSIFALDSFFCVYC